ncbi:MAG TPA: zinc ribbon domain-containing protein, partial [Polyangia bacterium]
MNEFVRCPHCKAELPEKASFCASCGRRIEGWSLPKDATPALGQTALPGSDEATRQVQPTPSLLRAAALSVKRSARGGRRGIGLTLVVAMLLVAIGGGLGGFFVVRARVRRSPSIV